MSVDNQQCIQVLQKLKEGIAVPKIATDCEISIRTVLGVKYTVDKINLLKKIYSATKYRILSKHLHNWLLERKVLGDTISDMLFRDKVYQFISEYANSSTKREKENMLHEFKKCYENLLQSDSRSVPESSQNLHQIKNKKNAEKFIQEFTQRLKQENISKDNIYTMIKINLGWKYCFRCIKKGSHSGGKQKADVIEKFKNDSLTFIFCTNATGSHKLSPFCIYNYKYKEALKYLKNTSSLVTSKGNMSNEIFAHWYNNHFIKSVREHQQKTNVSGKTLLLIKNCEFPSEEITKDDSFEILFFPKYTSHILQPLDQRINVKIKGNLKPAFKDFYKSYDIENYIKAIYKPWTDITSAYIKNLWKTFFQEEKKDNSTVNLHKNKLTEKNVLQGEPYEKSGASTSNAKTEAERRQQEEQQEDIKSIAENTQRENVPMEILEINAEGEEQLENTRSIEDNTQNRNTPEILKMMHDIEEKKISPQDLTEYLKSYKKIEAEPSQ